MANSQDAYPEYVLRKKMKDWGILRDEPTDHLTHSLFRKWSNTLIGARLTETRYKPKDHLTPALLRLWSNALIRARPTETIDVKGEINELRTRVAKLERRLGRRIEPSKADYVYKLFEEELEAKHFGKIVAIDTDLKEVVGIGSTVLEAYKDAKKKTSKDQFDFRRVGYKYLYKV